MSKFALVGNGPLSNRGCEAIVLGSISILEREFGPSDFLLASFAEDSRTGLPENIEQLSLPYRMDRWSPAWWQYRFDRLLGRPENKSRFLHQLEPALAGVKAAFSIGGDGYAIEYGHQIVDRLVIMDNYIRSKDIPVIIWGASIGPFDKEPEFELQMMRHFADIDLIVVREPVSLDYLNGFGIKDNVCLVPDPAFALEPQPCTLSDDIERILTDQCMGINLSPLLARFATNGSLENWTGLAVKIIRRLLAEIKMPILLIPHATFDKLLPQMDDEHFMRGVYGALTESEKKQVSILPRGLTSQNLKWIIGRTSLFVGARTHATIAALSSFVPCLSIAYSRKAWGINELVFGHRKWVYSSEHLDPDLLIQAVNNLLHSSKEIRSYLHHAVPVHLASVQTAVKKVRLLVS